MVETLVMVTAEPAKRRAAYDLGFESTQFSELCGLRTTYAPIFGPPWGRQICGSSIKALLVLLSSR